MYNDNYFMQLALNEAHKAFKANEVPIGAVIVLDNNVIAAAFNQVETLQNATAHAEMLAIKIATETIGNWRLENATLYVTKEPCAMCAGAMVNSRLKRVVYAMRDPRSGACGGAIDITGFAGMLHQVQTTAGILEDDATFLIQTFFKQKRLEKKFLKK
ncbi:MAG: tRNA adenosine(34) deaminase TadA [Lentisphaeria bacterium]